jgi:hypothetical protein
VKNFLKIFYTVYIEWWQFWRSRQILLLYCSESNRTSFVTTCSDNVFICNIMLDVSLSDNFQISLSILTVSLGDIKEEKSILPINVYEVRQTKWNCHHSQINNKKNINTSKYATKPDNKYVLLIFTYLMAYKKICNLWGFSYWSFIQQYFSYIEVVNFIGGRNWSTWRKQRTCPQVTDIWFPALLMLYIF